MKVMRWIFFALAFVLCIAAQAQKVRCSENANVKLSDADSTLNVVEKQAYIKDGSGPYYTWIDEHMNATLKSKKNSRKKKVFTRFIVHENGSLSGFKITKGVGSPYNEEAIRLVKENPHKWVAGQCGDKKVKTWTTVVVEF